MKQISLNKNEYWMHIVLSIISVLILISIYYYLDTLKDCKCFIDNEDKTYTIDIEFLKFYQLLEIIALIVFVFLITIYKNKLFKGGGNRFGMKFCLILSIIVLLLITGYVSYNTILFFLLTKKNCKCVNKWQKYIIYIQGVFNSIYFLRICYLISFVLLMILFNFRN